MIQRQKHGLGMSRKQDARERGRQNRSTKKPQRTPIGGDPQNEIEGHRAQADQAVIHPPDGHEKITSLPLVGVPALGASVQRSKPFCQGACLTGRGKDRFLPARRTTQYHGAVKIKQPLPQGAGGTGRLVSVMPVHARWYGCPVLQLSSR